MIEGRGRFVGIAGMEGELSEISTAGEFGVEGPRTESGEGGDGVEEAGNVAGSDWRSRRRFCQIIDFRLRNNLARRSQSPSLRSNLSTTIS